MIYNRCLVRIIVINPRGHSVNPLCILRFKNALVVTILYIIREIPHATIVIVTVVL